MSEKDIYKVLSAASLLSSINEVRVQTPEAFHQRKAGAEQALAKSTWEWRQ
jgi:hypothetical protein